MNGRPTGAIRISFGYMSLKTDADAFLNFMRDVFVDFNSLNDGVTHGEDRTTRLDSPLSPDGAFNGKCARPKLSQICLYPVKSCAALKVGLNHVCTKEAYNSRSVVSSQRLSYANTVKKECQPTL